jgi:hypothetical protein
MPTSKSRSNRKSVTAPSSVLLSPEAYAVRR